MLLIAGLVIGVSFGAQTAQNARITGEAARLAQDDLPLQPGLDARALRDLAILEVAPGRPQPPGCNAICALLLGSGAADRVILAPQPYGTEVADPPKDQTGTAYWLEPRDTCPELTITNEGEIARPWGADNLDGASNALMLQAAAASGLCLVSAEAALSQAATLLVLGPVNPMAGPGRLDRSPWADAVGASRLALYLREGAGWRPVLRQTGVTAAPFLHPVPIPGFGYYGAPGSLLAFPRTLNSQTPPDWGDAGPGFGARKLLWDDLGLDTRTGAVLAQRLETLLPLPQEPARRAKALDVLENVLGSAWLRDPEPPEIEAFIDRLASQPQLAEDWDLQFDLKRALARRP